MANSGAPGVELSSRGEGSDMERPHGGPEYVGEDERRRLADAFGDMEIGRDDRMPPRENYLRNRRPMMDREERYRPVEENPIGAGDAADFYDAQEEVDRDYQPAPGRPYYRQAQFDRGNHHDRPPAARHIVNPVVKTPPYDGTSSWQDYLIQFEMIADLNGWDDNNRALFLAAGLRGNAQEVLGDLDAARRRHYPSLLAKLSQRFGPQNQTEMFRSLLRNRTRKNEETLPELAHSIRRLVKQSYPTGDFDLLECLAKDHFIDALTDADSRWRIQQTRPRKLDDAVRVAVELEAFQQAEKQRGLYRKPAIRTVQFQTTSADKDEHNAQLNDLPKTLSDIQAKLNDITRQMQPSMTTSAQPRPRDNPQYSTPRQPGACFECNEMGHFKNQCPKLRGRNNNRSYNRSHSPSYRPRYNNNQGNSQNSGN